MAAGSICTITSEPPNARLSSCAAVCKMVSNRVDELIMFRPLSKTDVKQIVELQLDQLMKKLEEKDIHLTPSEELVEHIVEGGYDPQFGARPIKRMIQKELPAPAFAGAG